MNLSRKKIIGREVRNSEGDGGLFRGSPWFRRHSPPRPNPDIKGKFVQNVHKT
ncbi:MAG: hypothetical protein OET21_15155 [Desulfobacterales bacterium]|nr:hypothetical protein [Desulfobacterales bacterium]